MRPSPIASAACALALAALASQASSNTSPSPMHPPSGGPVKLPDLIISSFGLKSWGTCAPGKTVMTFQVAVKNQGLGPMPMKEVLVHVRDLKSPAGQEWGAGDGEMYSLAPGQTHVYSVPIAYYSANPGYMTNGAPHPFAATVNGNHSVTESNYANNDAPGPATWNAHKVIMTGAPKGCPK